MQMELQTANVNGGETDKNSPIPPDQQCCNNLYQSHVDDRSGQQQTVKMGVFRETSVAISACLCMFVTGCWIAWPSPALKKLLNGEARITLTPEEASWAVAMLDIGNMISPIPSAFLVDRLGRKTLLLFTGPLFLMSSLLTFPTGSRYYLYFARFLSGVGKGVTFTICPMYLGEIASVNVRGALSTIMTGFLWGGSILIFIAGPLVSYSTLNLLLGILPILFFLTFMWMPESPYSLLMRDKYSGAKASLEWLRESGEQTDKELMAMKDNVEEEMQTKGSYSDLITIPSNRKATAIVMVSSAFQRLTGISCALSYSSTTLPLSSGLSVLGQNEIIMAFGVILTMANFLATPLVDSLGRKPLLLVSSVGISICMGCTGLYYLLVPSLDVMRWLPYASLLGFGLCQGIGVGVIPSTLLSELFPSNVKSKAAAVASIVFALGSFLTNKMYIPVKTNFGVHYMFFFFSLCGLSSFVFTLFAVFETKGKTFPEIQQRLKRK
ncbi:facilitated trehalose transporter Tret1-like isoform X2 [Lycorma delicatula]